MVYFPMLPFTALPIPLDAIGGPLYKDAQYMREVPDFPAPLSPRFATIWSFSDTLVDNPKAYSSFFVAQEISDQIRKIEDFLMPSKYKSSPRNSSGNIEYVFCNVRLSPTDAKQFKAWYAEYLPAFEELMVSMLLSGHKQSVSWQEKDQCYLATLTCNDERSDNRGKIMSSRSDDFMEAILMNIFKANVLLEGREWPSESATNKWG